MPRSIVAALFVCLHLFAVTLCGQQRVSLGAIYHRVWAVTPLVGSGKPGDPLRPMFVSATPPAASDRSGVLAYQMQLSDDGKFALVEFVFASPAAFQAVLQKEASARGVSTSSQSPSSPSAAASGPSPVQTALQAAVAGLAMFERGNATQSAVVAEFTKHKANFTFDRLRPVPVE
jgi:hypothetical protein